MDDTKYLKDGVARVLGLMRTTFGDDFKAYFNGEPANIPEYSLPCVIVSETIGSIESGATGTDVITETVTIILVLNKKDYIGGAEDIDTSELAIRQLVKGQDNTTSYPYQYMEKSVMYALRTFITMDETVISNQVQTEFGPSVRVGADGDNLATEEAYVTLNIERQALVPSRS